MITALRLSRVLTTGLSADSTDWLAFIYAGLLL